MDSQNCHNLNITAHTSTGYLERILRIIRVRGFNVLTISANTHDEMMKINLTLTGRRSIENLQQQLLNLLDVKTVTLNYPNRLEQLKPILPRSTTNSLQQVNGLSCN